MTRGSLGFVERRYQTQEGICFTCVEQVQRFQESSKVLALVFRNFL